MTQLFRLLCLNQFSDKLLLQYTYRYFEISTNKVRSVYLDLLIQKFNGKELQFH